MALKTVIVGKGSKIDKAVTAIASNILNMLDDKVLKTDGTIISTRKKLTNALREYNKATGGNKILPYGKVIEEKLLNETGVKTLRKRTKNALKIAPFFNKGREALSLLDKLYSFPDLFDAKRQKLPGEKANSVVKPREPEDVENASGLKKFKNQIGNLAKRGLDVINLQRNGKEGEGYAKLKLPRNLGKPMTLPKKMPADNQKTILKALETAYNGVLEKFDALMKRLTPSRETTQENIQEYSVFIQAIIDMYAPITNLRKAEIKISGKSNEAVSDFYDFLKTCDEKSITIKEKNQMVSFIKKFTRVNSDTKISEILKNAEEKIDKIEIAKQDPKSIQEQQETEVSQQNLMESEE